MDRMQAYFTQVRAWLQSSDGVKDTRQLWDLLKGAYNLDRERYQGEFLGYLSAFELPVYSANNLDRLVFLSELLPENAPRRYVFDRRISFSPNVLSSQLLGGVTQVQIGDRYTTSYRRDRYDVRRWTVGDGEIEQVVGAEHWGDVAWICVCGDMSARGAHVLWDFAARRGCVDVKVEGNPIGDAGVETLVGSGLLGRLDSLNLRSVGCTDEGVKALASGLGENALRVLDLQENEIGDEGAVALAGAPLYGLEDLLLGGNDGIGERGRKALEESVHLPSGVWIGFEVAWRQYWEY